MPVGGKSENISWDDKDLPVIDGSLSSSLSKIESAGGDYTAVNPHTGALGKYQFVPSYHWDNIKKVTGVKSKSDFLNNHEAQERYFQWHTENNILPSVERIRKYNKDGYSDDQLKMLVHFKGEGGGEEWLKNHSDETSDNNVSINEYIGNPKGATTTWNDNDLPVIADPQKKSPDVSANGLANSSQAGQNGVSANNTNSEPQLNGANANQAQSPQQSSAANPLNIQYSNPSNQGAILSTGVNVTPATEPILPAPPVVNPSAPEQTKSAVETIAKDYLDNQHQHPQEMQSAFQNNPIGHPDNSLNQITNPNGDPAYTGQYFKNRQQQLEKEKQDVINSAGYNDPSKSAGLNPNGITDINNQYNKKIADLHNASNYLISQQLFKKEYENKPLTDEEATTKLSTLEKQRDDQIKTANLQMDEDVKSDQYKTDINAADEKRKNTIAKANEDFQAATNQVKSQVKWDGVRLGIEQKRLMGDPQAAQDAINYDAGKPISPARKYQYQLSGNEIKKIGVENSTDQAAKEGDKHIDSDKKIEHDNLDYLKGEWANKIGNAKYNDENPLIHALIPHFGSMSPEDVKKYGKQAGLKPSQIEQVDPSEVPISATLYSQAAKGLLNTAAPVYEQSIRALSALTGGDQEAVNNHFQPGWENQRGLGAAIMGNVPSDQNSFHNLRGAAGQVLEGAAGLATFTGEIGAATKVIEATGLVSKAETAEKLANFGVMAFNGYNSAYKNANEELGDKPEDEWKRQTYALTRGLIEGAIFSISPASKLIKNALGEEEKGGEQLLDEIKNAKGAEVLQSPEFKEGIAKKIIAVAAENGKQVSLSSANEIAKGIINTVTDPSKKQDISEEVKQNAISTSLAMLLPSILGGVGHVNNETKLNEGALFELGTNPDKYTNFISGQLSEGKINQQQASQMHDAIITMKNVISQTPTADISGKPLTPDQIKAYSFSMFQEHLLEQKVNSLTEGAKQAGNIPVDKAQLEPLNKRISQLQKQRVDILKDAGEGRPPVLINAIPEQANSEPEQERSVEPESSSKEQTPTEKKSSEKEANNKESTIPLSSQQKTEQKTTENGNERISRTNVQTSIENDEGKRQKGSPLEPEREITDKTGNGENRDEQQEAGLLKVKEENTEQKATPTEQPLSVTGKRRKLIVDVPEEIPTPTKNNSYAAWDQRATEGKPQDKTEEQIKSTPSDEKIGGGESFNEFADRIHKTWDETKKESKDQTVQFTHSSVMKMIEAGEEHGWDNKDDQLRKAYNEKTEPEVGEKKTYKTANGEIHLLRHAESEDGANNLTRTKDTPLTDKGKEEAATVIPEALNEEGIKPSEIISDDQPRTAETAAIVHKELSNTNAGKSEYNSVDEIERERKDEIKIYRNRHTEWEDEIAKSGGNDAADLLEEGMRKWRKKLKEINEKYDKELKLLKENASTQSIEQQQESHEQGSKPEHARTEQAGSGETPASSKSSDSHIGGEEKKEITFKTSKGSEYILHEDGTTTRNKAPRNEPGHEGQQGEQPRSEKTYFVTKDDLNKLDLIQTSGWQEGETPTIADLKDGKIAVGVTGGERHGQFIGKTKVEYQSEPKEGLYPLEVWDNGTKHHFGNEITEVNKKPQEVDIAPPQPDKPLHQMTSEELDSYYNELRKFNKNLDKQILGSKHKEYKSAQDILNSVLASKESRTVANKTISDIEKSLSEKQLALLNGDNLHIGDINNEEQVRDYRDKVDYIESANSENELAKYISQSLIDLNDAPHSIGEMSEHQKMAVAAMNATKRVIEERGYNGRNITQEALKFAANKFSDERDAELMLSKYLNISEQSPSEPEQERSVAPAAKKEEQTPAQRLSQIDLNIKMQRASQIHEGNLRSKAEKENDIPSANKHNENWYKKQDRIDNLEEQRKEVLKEQKEAEYEQVKESYNKLADRIEKRYEKNKKEHEGAAYSSILGLSHKIGDHIADFVVARVVEGIRQIGNIDVAIRRAIRLAKEKFGDEAKELSLDDIDKIKGATQEYQKPLPNEPILPVDHEEYAKDILADILSGKMTHEEAKKEIWDEVIENREGKPVSAAVSENAKAKILNYLDWHIQNDITSIKNATTRLRREQFGLNEEIPAAKKEFGETWDEAKNKIENNPQAPLNLIEELSKKARPLTDVENAILLHHQNTKEIELQNINDNINKAADENDQGAIIENKVSKARLLDELQQIYDINKAVGTENARGLASRRMMVDRKYSLVNMIAEKRATANEGKALSEEQQADIEKLHSKIKETQGAFDNYVKESESKIIDLQRKALSGPLQNKKTASKKLHEWADRIRKAAKNQAYSSPIPITPHMVADAIDLIASGVEKGEKLVDLIKQAINKASKDNPGIDENDLEKEINKELIDSGILEPSKAKKSANDMSGLFADGKLDREALRLKVEADRAKAQYDINLKRDKEKQLSKAAKFQNWFIKWQRAFKLSNPLTMGKLMMAGITRLTTTPLEDIVGGAYSAVLPQLAKGAIGEGGGLNVTETAKAYKDGLLRGLKDAKEVLSKKSQGKSELDVLFGKAGELPPEAIDFFGQLHSATKAPIKRAIFERSLERRLRRNAANGVDITDPMVQTSILVDAYKDANRAIFMQDNKVAEGWQKLVKHFDQVDPSTGKAPHKIIASTLQWMMPFVKVPTNIAAEIGTHVYGAPVAAYKLIHAAFTDKIENLPADEKEIILRNLKKGSLGIAALALGYFNPQNFGGFYQPGQKRDEDDAEALGLKLFGTKIPSWFVEAPIYQAMQLGATVRRVKDRVVKGEEQGIGEGLWAGVSGLVNDIPMASQPMRVAKLFTSKHEREYYLGELAKSTADPALVTYFAKVTDPADEGNPIRKALAPENKRATPTIGEHIKSGIPFLREGLDEKGGEHKSHEVYR